MATKYILNYFPLSGRAECARLMFHVAGVEFTDNQIPFAEWPQQKGDVKRFPLGHIPTLEVDGVTICESSAIYRYLANEFDLGGSTNMEKCIIDQILSSLRDVFQGFGSIKRDKSKDDAAKKLAYAEHFGSDIMKRTMGFLVGKLKSSGGPFFLGDKITVADCLYFPMHEYMVADFPEVLDTYPELVALQKEIENVKSVKKYLSTRKHGAV